MGETGEMGEMREIIGLRKDVAGMKFGGGQMIRMRVMWMGGERAGK